MKWIYEFAAAFFFAAAGYLAADAVPDKTVGAIVGVCLLLVGAVLLAAGLQGLLKKLEECRAAEKEQAEKRAAELKAAVEILQEKLQTLCENSAAMQATLTAEHTAATSYYAAQTVQGKVLHNDLLKKLEECRADEKEQAEKRAAALNVAAEAQQKKLQTLCENSAAMQATLTAEHTAATSYYAAQTVQGKVLHNDLLKKLEECRADEKEQAEKRAAALNVAAEAQQKKLQTLCENSAAMQATLTAEHTAATKYYETQSVQEKTLHDDLLKKLEECRAAEKEQVEKRAAELKAAAEIQQKKLQTLCENSAAMQATLAAEHTAATNYYETQSAQERVLHDDLLKKLENSQDKTAGTIYTACLELQNNVKKLCDSTTKKMGAVQRTLEDSLGDQKKAIRGLCTDMKECLGEARDFMGEQQGQFTGALHQENEDNRTKLDQILQNYAQLTSQDLDALRALGLSVEENNG
mgnify:CR=1 FL=1